MLEKNKQPLRSEVLGVAFHSPLDLYVLMPLGTRVTTKASEDADVFFGPAVVNSSAKYQFIFASAKTLQDRGIKIIDASSKGKLVSLKGAHLDAIFSPKKVKKAKK